VNPNKQENNRHNTGQQYTQNIFLQQMLKTGKLQLCQKLPEDILL